MRNSVRLGRLFGIPVGVNITWFIVFAMVSMSLATGYFPDQFPGWGWAGYWGMGLLTSLLFFACVLFHELSHSLVARARGIPVKSITLFIFGGVANIDREPDRPLAEFLIAIAGPVSSLVLAGVFWGVLLAGRALGLAPMASLGLYLAALNLSLAVFNLVPGFPLDGGRVLRAAVWARTGSIDRATHWAATVGRAIAMLMIAGGGVLIILGDWQDGVWLAFIGWFLESAATQSAQQVNVRVALEGYTAADFARDSCQAVDRNTPLDWVVRDYVLPHGDNCFIVTDSQRPEGVATLGQIQQVPRQRWGWTPVRQIMTPLNRLKPVRASEAAFEVLERMMREGQSLLPVVDGDRLVGLVRRDNLLRFAQTRTALKI